jgi:hypothetical protein
MADDFRLQIELDASGDGFSFAESMRELSLERDARKRLGDRVAVSADGPKVFVYTDTEEAANEARRVIGPLLAEHRLTDSALELTRWHPEEERWEPVDKPLPSTPEEEAAEHAVEEADDTAESVEQGFAEWEVRVELPSHGETVAFADRLEQEGIPVLRRWKFLLVGAPNEDEAEALAQRIESEAPQGSKVHAEISGAAVWKVGDPFPFAVFGGLGG